MDVGLYGDDYILEVCLFIVYLIYILFYILFVPDQFIEFKSFNVLHNNARRYSSFKH